MKYTPITFLKNQILELNTVLSKGGEKSLKSYLVKGATGSLGVKLTSIGLRFLTGIILARLLGPEGLGSYSYVLAIISVLVVPTQLGLPELLVREVASLQAREKWHLLKGMLIRSNQFVLVVSLLLVFICSLFLLMNPNFWSTEVVTTFGWALPMLILMPLAALRSSALRGLSEIIRGILPEHVVKPLSFLIILGILFALSEEGWLNPQRAMAANTISFFLAFLIGAYWLKKNLPVSVMTSVANFRTKAWMKSAGPFMILGGLTILNQKIDLVLLGSLGTHEQVGLFEVANRAASFVALSLSAINQVLGPLFSSLWVQQDLQRLQKVLTRSTQAVVVFALPVALTFIFAGDWILNFFFGAEYMPAATALALLCGGYLFNAVIGSVGVLLNMSGHERYTAFGVGVSVISNVVLDIWLIPFYGIEGAAFASLISFVLWNCFLSYAVYRKPNIIPSILFTIKTNKNE